MRIRSKLGLILLIPLVAVVALAGMRLFDTAQRAVAADLVQSLTDVAAHAASVTHELHRERMAAMALLDGRTEGSTAFNAQATRTDRAVAAFRDARDRLGSTPTLVRERLDRVEQQLGTLNTIRQEILGDTNVTATAAVLRYGVIITDLINYQESVAQVAGDPDLAESVRAVTTLSKAKAQMSEAQAIGYLALRGGSLDREKITAFQAAQTAQQEALLAFALAASPEQLALVNTTLTGAAVVLAENVSNDLIRATGGRPGISAEDAERALGAMVNLVRYAEEKLYADQLAQATALRDTVVRQVLVESAVVLAVLLVAVAVAFLLARSLARSLGRLRDGALAVAHRELPQTVAHFSDPKTLGEHTPAEIAAQVRDPIALQGRDEVAEVAQAFNVVHQAAVRVAAEQAALRTSVSTMFLNLARRSQALVDRMINQLDEIERNEEDPKRLARLFALDHLATRMRRNDENLLVLAGADSSPPRTDDAAIPDVLRAAQSEIEHYDRIEFGTVDSDVSVVALAVNDVVRLVAELFDNATRFSPPDTPVVAEGRRLGDQVIIQIEDRGVGMPYEQTEQLNAWLASPPALEITTFRRMGLAVVARLAARHGIRVELRSGSRSGTTAYVALPPSILVLPQYRSRIPEVPMQRPPRLNERLAVPPVPARHLGQLPRRAELVNHVQQRTSLTSPLSDDRTDLHHQTVSTHDRPETLEQPVAGRPPEDLVRRINSLPPAPAHSQPVDTTVELPIFQQTEAMWFRKHGVLDLGGDAGGDRGSEPTRTAHSGTEAPTLTNWRSPADSGWTAAAAAAKPPVGGVTRSGLPKRVPQAQLVPGSVETGGGQASTGVHRRSPDEVRGLLSAYHRGVQRGRDRGGR